MMGMCVTLATPLSPCPNPALSLTCLVIVQSDGIDGAEHEAQLKRRNETKVKVEGADNEKKCVTLYTLTLHIVQ